MRVPTACLKSSPGHGGARPGAGRRQKTGDGRQWARGVVDARRARLERELDLLHGEAYVSAYNRLYEAGYGRPPQALRVGGGRMVVEVVSGGQIEGVGLDDWDAST